MDGNAGLGETVDIVSAKGEFLAKAAYSPHSSIRARAWSWLDTAIDAEFLRTKLDAAISRRKSSPLPMGEGVGVRVVHAESDGIPGLIVDRYGNDLLVIQVLTAGTEYWRETIADLLVELTGIPNIYERSDVDVRSLEGLEPRTGILRGSLPEETIISEYGIRFNVDVVNGHKTGFYLDQRENRHLVGQLANNRDVLNCFCYTGGFSIHAAAGGAKLYAIV